MMKDLGYGDGYRYAHDFEDGYVVQDYLPDAIAGKRFYRPVERGYEKIIAERLRRWQAIKAKSRA